MKNTSLATLICSIAFFSSMGFAGNEDTGYEVRYAKTKSVYNSREVIIRANLHWLWGFALLLSRIINRGILAMKFILLNLLAAMLLMFSIAALAVGDDSDGDGIPDWVELGCIDYLMNDCPAVQPDSDSDGTPDYQDADDDNDNIPTILEGDADADGDGVPNYLDEDSDGDGKSDLDEGDGDNDGDYVVNFLDSRDDSPCPEELFHLDSDGDGLSDAAEMDEDCFDQDTDGDGIPNRYDGDDDGDGILTSQEIINDGYYGSINLATGEVTLVNDVDGDGIPNYLDLDSDGDGKSDADEWNPSQGTHGTDSDFDGILNFLDPEDHDGPHGDWDMDGLSNGLEESIGSDPLSSDTDGDGHPDGEEYRGEYSGSVLHDSDKDGIPDLLDADDDGDGIPTLDEGSGDLDGDGIPNYLDLDSDGDGIPDSEDLPTSDDDCDGIPNWGDTDPTDGPCWDRCEHLFPDSIWMQAWCRNNLNFTGTGVITNRGKKLFQK